MNPKTVEKLAGLQKHTKKAQGRGGGGVVRQQWREYAWSFDGRIRRVRPQIVGIAMISALKCGHGGVMNDECGKHSRVN